MTQELLTLTGIVLDDELSISMRELCRVCGVTAERIMDMVEEGVVDPRGASPREWHFSGKAVVRAQVALRLQRDLRVNLAGAALVLDLLEELEELRRLHGRYNM
jgi:chaperone modulatory protein CbpM